MVDAIFRLGLLQLSAVSLGLSMVRELLRSDFLFLSAVSLALALVFISMRGGSVRVEGG